ncbi:MAG: hypothetical protein NTZ67_06715 [Gammaproteobacteria bacterium]|nr:hypothetical protein [Gammaproteobacteria bacterium]
MPEPPAVMNIAPANGAPREEVELVVADPALFSLNNREALQEGLLQTPNRSYGTGTL